MKGRTWSRALIWSAAAGGFGFVAYALAAIALEGIGGYFIAVFFGIYLAVPVIVLAVLLHVPILALWLRFAERDPSAPTRWYVLAGFCLLASLPLPIAMTLLSTGRTETFGWLYVCTLSGLWLPRVVVPDMRPEEFGGKKVHVPWGQPGESSRIDGGGSNS